LVLFAELPPRLDRAGSLRAARGRRVIFRAIRKTSPARLIGVFEAAQRPAPGLSASRASDELQWAIVAGTRETGERYA
jgi:hypothetical protein